MNQFAFSLKLILTYTENAITLNEVGDLQTLNESKKKKMNIPWCIDWESRGAAPAFSLLVADMSVCLLLGQLSPLTNIFRFSPMLPLQIANGSHAQEV